LSDLKFLFNLTNMIYLLFTLLIAMEVAWDWYHMEKLNKSPNYAGSNMIRVFVGLAFWAISPRLKEMSPSQYLFIPIIMVTMFWFLFDWWLNLARTWSGNQKPYWYLGEKSDLDQWQRNHGGAFRWFWIKLSIVIICLIIFETII